MNKRRRNIIIAKVRQGFFDEVNKRLDDYVNDHPLTMGEVKIVRTYKKYLKSLEALYKAEDEAKKLYNELGIHTPVVATLYSQRLEADLISEDVSGYEPIDELVKKYSRFTYDKRNFA